MNFELTEDQQQIRDTFARFCDERIAPQAAALDEARSIRAPCSRNWRRSASSACATPKMSAAAASR
jgi:alkylation response protein AidB-like acyl-CoA dehydrogenase